MYLDADLAGILDGGDVACYDGRDARGGHGVDDLAHPWQLGVVDDSVDGEVALDPGFVADAGDAAQVVECEIDRRTRAHVQPLYTEIYCIRSGLDGGVERFV